MIRVQIDRPEEGNKKIVAALRAVGAALKAEVVESTTAPADSYSLTVHVLPDPVEG